MHQIKKIISGGQTGVDQAALKAAFDLSIATGGWCPPEFLIQNDALTTKYGLRPTPNERSEKTPLVPRSLRTEWNVRDSDGTLIITPLEISHDQGCQWTFEAAENYHKHCLVVSPTEKKAANNILNWIKENQLNVINIAGPAEKDFEGIGNITYKFLLRVFSQF